MIDLDRIENLLILADRIVNGAAPTPTRKRARRKKTPQKKARVVKGRVIPNG